MSSCDSDEGVNIQPRLEHFKATNLFTEKNQEGSHNRFY